MSESKNKLLVFLSYAREDKPKVWRLCKRLKQDGFDPWLDEDRLLPGQDWNLEIEKALRISDVILLCFSTRSLQKEGYIQREYKRAMKYQEEKPDGVIFVIPVRLDECKMPIFIQELQSVDYPEQYDRLAMALNQRLVESDLPPVSVIPSQVKKRVDIVLEGEFSEFTPSRQQDVVSVLAALLKVESSQIRVLTVYEGSIVIIIEMPDIAANHLYEIARGNNNEIKSLGIKSISIEGREIIKLSDKFAKIESMPEQLQVNSPTQFPLLKTGGTISIASLEEILLRYNVVTGNLNHQHSMNEALNNIGNGAIHIFRSSHAAIYLQNSKGDIDCVWYYGMPGDYRTLFESAPKEKISTTIFGTPRLTYIPNVRMEVDTLGLSDLTLPEFIQSICFCPLSFNGQVFAVMGLFFDHLRPLTTVEMQIMEAYANQAAVTLKSSSLFNQLEKNYRDIALVLTKAMDERDTPIPEYSHKLSRWAEAIAKELGCTEKELKDIRLAALLHDVGKVAIPDSVVKKAGSLNKEERDILKRYPIVSNIIRNERERYDGKGYPDGRKGEEIPLGARIIAVADAYGSMINERPYQKQKARPPAEAIKELEQKRGKQFDPVVIDAFLKLEPQRLN